MPLQSFTIRSVVALSFLAALVLWGQVLVQQQLKGSEHDSWLINFAGRQRFQSQLIVKDALLLTASGSLARPEQVTADLRRVLANWQHEHEQLRLGRLAGLDKAVPNSDSIQQMFTRIRPHFEAILTGAGTLLTDDVSPTGPIKQEAVRLLLSHEKSFLEQMDRLVFQYQREAEQRVTSLRRLELLLTGVTLLVLLLVGLLIFRPAIRELRLALDQLTAARNRSQEANALLTETNQDLRKTQQQLLEESLLRHQQQLSEQRIRMASLVQGQEEERRRLSRDLHDGTGQMLTGLKLLTENLHSTHLLPEKEQHMYLKTKELVVKIIQETRRISNSLMPPVLSDFGLEPALRYVAEQAAQQTGLAIRVFSQGADLRLDPALEIGLYRVAQEALTNTIRHANATNVEIDLRIRDNGLLLSISDDGQGVGAAQTNAVLTGQGLHNMRQRTRLMSGVLRLISQPGQGTRIVVTVPLNKPADENTLDITLTRNA